MSIERLDIIIQKTLPLVYDDSLSYLEFLAKVVAKVNEAIDELNIYLNQDLRSYVVQRLEEWQADGTLDQIISDTLTTGLDAVNDRVDVVVNNVGDRQYTEQNYVTNSETITDSIDQLDVGINDLKNNVQTFIGMPSGTDDTALLQTALNMGGKIVFPKNQTYLSDQVIVNESVSIDLNGSTIKRYTKPSGIMFMFTKDVELYNGIIDGENSGVAYGHLIHIDSPGYNVFIHDMQFLNNCLGFPNPVTGQDTDLIYIINANDIFIDRCMLDVASRQGLSLTGYARSLKINNCYINDCYLFGVDVELNADPAMMIEQITISNNTIKNCGIKSTTNFVFNSGGPMAISHPFNSTINVFKNIHIINNKIYSTDLITVTSMVEPYINISNYDTLLFSHNTIMNINRALLGTITHPALLTHFTDNVLYSEYTSFPSNYYLTSPGRQINENNSVYNTTIIASDLGKFEKTIGNYQLTNLISNGEFTTDLTGWTFGASITDEQVSVSALYFTGRGMIVSNSSYWVSQENKITQVNNVYYISVHAKKIGSSEGGIWLGNGYNTRLGTGITNDYVRYSTIFTPDNVESVNAHLTIGGTAGIGTYVDNVILVNLTATYGAGNEPTKEQFDSVMNSYPRYLMHI